MCGWRNSQLEKCKIFSRKRRIGFLVCRRMRSAVKVSDNSIERQRSNFCKFSQSKNCLEKLSNFRIYFFHRFLFVCKKIQNKTSKVEVAAHLTLSSHRLLPSSLLCFCSCLKKNETFGSEPVERIRNLCRVNLSVTSEQFHFIYSRRPKGEQENKWIINKYKIEKHEESKNKCRDVSFVILFNSNAVRAP